MRRRNSAPDYGTHAGRAYGPDPDLAAAIQRYKDAHWGMEHTRIYRVDDPDLPRTLTEMGKLRELSIRPLSPEGTLSRKAYQLQVPHVEHNILAFSFDPQAEPGAEDAFERLFIVLSPATMKKMAARYMHPEGTFYPLPQVAEHVGGRQNQWPYPNIPVQVLGELADITYYTAKGGDKEERSGVEYNHEHGEEGGLRPYVCIDKTGRFWLAGGDYVVAHEGIGN